MAVSYLEVFFWGYLSFCNELNFIFKRILSRTFILTHSAFLFIVGIRANV